MTITRRGLMAATSATLAAPTAVRAQATRVLKFVPQSNLTALDPIWTTAYVTRNHGLMVWDTLYGLDERFEPRPQMLEGHQLSDDRLHWIFTLREGLRWHDGAPVRAVDCVASIRRWAKRDAMGQRMMSLANDGETLKVLDDRRFEIRLAKPYPLLPYSLGKPATPAPFMMPERVANTDAFTQISPDNIVGSGPFRFRRDEMVSGSRFVYERFEGYVPRQEAPSQMAGGKVVQFDRVEWQVIPDGAAANGALINGEVDWWEQPISDLLPALRRNRNVVVEQVEPLGNIGIIRFNSLAGVFAKPAMRRAILPAIEQADFMTAVMGTDESLWRKNVGVFTPGTPLASEAGMDVLSGSRSVDEAKKRLQEAGYNGEKVVLLAATDFPVLKPMAEVTNDVLRRIGMNVEYVATDWGTVVQRRASKEPADKGGWSIFCTAWNGVDMLNPAGHQSIRGNGEQAWFGWPSAPRIEALRDAWFDAPDLAAQKKICDDIQLQVWEDVPYIPIGQYFQPTAYRRNLSGILKGAPVMFWNVRRT
jgi:peptide/nickel transport system substrate-binding protein